MSKNIIVSGPYYKFSKPYGTFVTCERDEYFVSRKLTDEELNSRDCSECGKITKKRGLGCIVMPHRRGVYIISQLFPEVSFKTLDEAIQFLVANENQLVFCS
jgi:hypothetical protein